MRAIGFLFYFALGLPAFAQEMPTELVESVAAVRAAVQECWSTTDTYAPLSVVVIIEFDKDGKFISARPQHSYGGKEADAVAAIVAALPACSLPSLSNTKGRRFNLPIKFTKDPPEIKTVERRERPITAFIGRLVSAYIDYWKAAYPIALSVIGRVDESGALSVLPSWKILLTIQRYWPTLRLLSMQ